MKNQTVTFRYGTIWKRLNTSKKTRRVSQKKKKNKNIVVEQSSLPQIQLKAMEPNVYFRMKLDFSTFFQ